VDVGHRTLVEEDEDGAAEEDDGEVDVVSAHRLRGGAAAAGKASPVARSNKNNERTGTLRQTTPPSPGTAQIEQLFHQIDTLTQEVNKLKCDKLDLLRQNVVRSLS
jgi:hypothetical protein